MQLLWMKHPPKPTRTVGISNLVHVFCDTDFSSLNILENYIHNIISFDLVGISFYSPLLVCQDSLGESLSEGVRMPLGGDLRVLERRASRPRSDGGHESGNSLWVATHEITQERKRPQSDPSLLLNVYIFGYIWVSTEPPLWYQMMNITTGINTHTK